jgi:aerobic-type carbon monoxide dehydrogenase small subunit (CoxS/CutS family)
MKDVQAAEETTWCEVTTTVNGRQVRFVAEGRQLLSDALREQVGATGVRIGCEHGICGSCTVLMDGSAVRSCLMFAAQADGHEIRTVESLADGNKLGFVQEAFRQEHGLQCGYCTAGIMLSTMELLERNPHPSEPEVMDMLGGHLCRCTGYQQVLNAINAAIGLREEAAP